MNKGQEQESPQQPKRRPWSRPQLVELGNVRDLTKASAGTVSDGRGLKRAGT